MATLEDNTIQEVSGDTSGPYEQFVTCTHINDFLCKYKDVQTNKCIFETCLIDSNIIPPMNLLWTFECVFCKQKDSIRPIEMKIHLCKTCIKRIQAVEALPITCRWCGQTITQPPSWPFSGLCETCLDAIRKAAGR
jgi:hypothetical protein